MLCQHNKYIADCQETFSQTPGLPSISSRISRHQSLLRSTTSLLFAHASESLELFVNGGKSGMATEDITVTVVVSRFHGLVDAFRESGEIRSSNLILRQTCENLETAIRDSQQLSQEYISCSERSLMSSIENRNHEDLYGLSKRSDNILDQYRSMRSKLDQLVGAHGNGTTVSWNNNSGKASQVLYCVDFLTRKWETIKDGLNTLENRTKEYNKNPGAGGPLEVISINDRWEKLKDPCADFVKSIQMRAAQPSRQPDPGDIFQPNPGGSLQPAQPPRSGFQPDDPLERRPRAQRLCCAIWVKIRMVLRLCRS